MKKVLVGIDFTDADDQVLDWVEALAKGKDVSVTLIHSVPPLAQWVGCYYAFVPQDIAQREEESKQFLHQLEGIAQRLRAAEIPTECAVRDQHPGPGLLRYAEDHDVDQIVIGTHSKNLVERALLGSTADHVVRKSPIPVLVVPTHR